MRGIALCDCIPEYDQTLCVGQTGIRFPVVTVQLPVGGPGCFSDYIDVISRLEASAVRRAWYVKSSEVCSKRYILRNSEPQRPIL